MYSVFLVEDECLIREGIRNLVNWEQYGFTFVGEAQDGEVAWPLIQKQRPDIVITDIRMPFMDGLALSRLIKKERPATTIIILSGYDDFSYAKEAISIGVSEYLLKPLSKEQLVKALQQIKARKDKEKSQDQYIARFHKEMQDYLAASRRAFFDMLVSGKYEISALLAYAGKLHLNLVAETYNIVLFLLEEDCLQQGYSALLADLQENLSNSLPQDENIITFSISVDMLAFLVKGDKTQIAARTNACVATLKSLCQPLVGTIAWSIETGEAVDRLSNIPKCYRAVRQKLFHQSVTDWGSALSTAQTGMDFNLNDMDASKMDQRIMQKFLSSGQIADVDTFVENYFYSIHKGAIRSIIFRQYVVLNFQFTVNAFLENIGCNKDTLHFESKLPLQNVFLSLEDLKKYVAHLLRWALTLRDQKVATHSGSMLHKALAYLEQHFSDAQINLNVVAKEANVSATYFSSVFSQQVGKTFVEYLTQLRMERAKELLRCTNMNSGDIAFAVGYNDPHYFSFLFKKVNGCSPRDYRAGKKTEK